MGTVSVRLALWGFERRTRRRRCWLMSGRAVAGRAGRDGRGGWTIAVECVKSCKLIMGSGKARARTSRRQLASSGKDPHHPGAPFDLLVLRCGEPWTANLG
jgi:hypothetical protein